MKERPIIFSGPMVQAILDGRKSQTRRAMNPQPEHDWANVWGRKPVKPLFITPWGENRTWVNAWDDNGKCWMMFTEGDDARLYVPHCPYGVPGDRLWCTQGSTATRATGFEERFWERVIKFDQCWEWFGLTNRKRYGVIRRAAKSYSTHRVSWEIHNGPIPSMMQVLHTCDLPWCVNPNHLWLGTNEDNIADKMAKGRHRAPSGECHKDSRLSWEQIDEIRALYWEQHLYQSDLAVRFGIHQSQVSKIANGKQWKAANPALLIGGHRTLERLTNRPPERVQDISEHDAELEGCSGDHAYTFEHEPMGHVTTAVERFHDVWDSLNAKRGFGWDTNPWCFVLDFKVRDA